MKKIARLVLVALLLAVLGLPSLRRRSDGTLPANAPPPPVGAQTASSASTPAPSRAAPASHTSPAPAAPVGETRLSGSSSLAARSVVSTPTPTDSGRIAPENPATRLASAATAADLLQAADLTDPAQRAYVVARIAEMEQIQREAALAAASRLGIPTRIEGPGGKVSLLHDFRDGRPLYRTTFNTNAAISTGANTLRDQPAPYGLNGAGMRVGVWDSAKVRNTHQEFPGDRVAFKDSASIFSDHATHVAGTIGAAGVTAAAKGMAPQVAIDSYDWNNDHSEMTAAGAATATDSARLPLSNHSYGYDAVAFDMGRYEFEARTLDALAASLPFYSIFQAAGNDRDVLTSLGGYQSITFNGLAKNVITIGAADDAVSAGLRAPAAGALAYFSSMGPCDDGRVKPDLTANGVGLNSPVSTSNTAYASYSGTSMATPNALGSALLVQQLHAREFSGQLMRASMLKALLIHTADDVGRPGPDYQYGWGYLNARAAADLVLAHKASPSAPKLIEGTITNSAKTRTHVFTWDGATPIRATLCWTDPAGSAQTAADSRLPNLVHDLDLKLTAPDGVTVTRPYVMPFVGTWTPASMTLNATTGVNQVDNVEQLRVAAPSQPGVYTLTVSLTGPLTTASQIYSLVVTGGGSLAANPAPVVTLDSPADGAVFLVGAPVSLAATATDKTINGTVGVLAGVEFFNDASSLGVVSTAPYAKTWTPPAPGAYTLSALATDSEGATARSSSARITVLSGDGSPTITNLTPASGDIGDIITLTGTNFTAVSAVRFNGVSAVFTVDSLTSIRATVPATATTGVVTVVASRGTAASANVFTVIRRPVIISQVYGGGGLAGATHDSDYVELHNRGDATVNLAGWSVQYATSSGTAWQTAPLAGNIAPGTYYLVKLASGSTGAALPFPDAVGSLNLASNQGKIALRDIDTPFVGSSPLGQTGLQDFVGYGPANAAEGSPAPSPSATTALFRAAGGVKDTGDNSADFVTTTPNPRNTLLGPPPAPVVTSPPSANGEFGKAFSYQITASNTPTSFSAAGLPAGLSVNADTGLVSGVLAAGGTYGVTVSASNISGTGSATLTLAISPPDSVIFSENMGAPAGGTPITANVFQNAGLVFTGTAEVRVTMPSSGYAGASGGGNIAFGSTVGNSFEISGLDTRGYANLALRFGHHKNTNTSSNELSVSVSADGQSYTSLSYVRPSGSGTANTWALVTAGGAIPATANLRLRFSQTTGGAQFRIDDVMLTARIPVPTFAEWAAGLADAAPAADPDGDGAPNLLEYFMALDPEAADASTPQATVGGGSLHLDYRRSKTLNGVIGAVEWSASLAGAWSTTGVADVLISDEGPYELRRASVPLVPGEPARFLRLRVTRP